VPATAALVALAVAMVESARFALNPEKAAVADWAPAGVRALAAVCRDDRAPLRVPRADIFDS
jgi:hypothetical protein